MARIQITKMEAVRAQLDAAIELYFISDNVIAIHSLAAAACEVLKDIAIHEGKEYPFLQQPEFINSLPDSERKGYLRFIKAPHNFFKHADRDPTGRISFNPELTELLLLDACGYFRDSTVPKPKYYDVFIAWAGNIKSDIPLDSVEQEIIEVLVQALRTKGKKEFWKLFQLRYA
jgi:hypothetical protein